MSVDVQAMAPMTRPSNGFCIIRVDAEQRGLLIVLILNSDGRQVSTERTYKVREITEAVRIVREFLQEFVT